MSQLSIWLGFHSFTRFKLQESFSVQSFFLSSDWGICSNVSGGLFVFKLPLQSPHKPLNISVKVMQISFNHSMALILTTSGDIWLWGEDNSKSGLFGQQNIYFSQIPIKLDNFSSSQIMQANLSDTHAGALCSEGFLYTWGTGLNGELCSELTSSPRPQIVENSKIFNISQVLCGKNYTAICTKGGFMYIYGKKHDFAINFANQVSQPFAIQELEDHFIDQIFDSNFGIILLTDEGKCFLLENSSKRIIGMNCNKKLRMVATCKNGVVGITNDKKKMYMWAKDEYQWVLSIFKFKNGLISYIQSGKSDVICVVGSCLEDVEKVSMYGESPETSPLRTREKERLEFDEIFSKYETTIASSGLNLQKESCTNMVKVISKPLIEVFRALRNYVLVQIMFKKAYASSFTPNYIEKAIQRAILVKKSFAFQCIKSFSQYHCNTDPKLFNCVRGIRLVSSKLFRVLSKWVFKKIVGNKFRKRSAYLKRKNQIADLLKKASKRFRMKVLNRIIFKGNRESFRKTVLKKFKFNTLKKKLDLYFDVLINKSLINQRKVSFIRISVLTNLKIEQVLQGCFKKWLKSLDKWKSQKIIDNLKRNAAILIFSQLQSVVKTRYLSLLSLIKPKKTLFEYKYGAFMLYSTLNKVIHKKVIQSFNAVLRFHFPSYVEMMGDLLKIVVYRWIVSCFHAIKIYSMNAYNQKIVKCALFFQSYYEKSKYRQALRGFNAFKVPFFNKSMYSEMLMEKSFRSQAGYSWFITPPGSPGPDSFNDSDIKMTSLIVKSSSNLNIERKASLTSMQKSLVLKFSEKITNESKSGQLIVPSKSKGKTQVKAAIPEKKSALTDFLKDKQKKPLIKPKEPISLIQKKKIEVLAKTPSKSIFDEADRKVIRYRNSSENLKNVIQKFLKTRLLHVFFSLKHHKGPRKSKAPNLLNILQANPQSDQAKDSIKTLSIASKSTISDLTPKKSSQSSVWKSKLISLGLNKIFRIIILHEKKSVITRFTNK